MVKMRKDALFTEATSTAIAAITAASKKANGDAKAAEVAQQAQALLAVMAGAVQVRCCTNSTSLRMLMRLRRCATLSELVIGRVAFKDALVAVEQADAGSRLTCGLVTFLTASAADQSRPCPLCTRRRSRTRLS